MSKYALFLGCMIPLRLPYMEMEARKVLQFFDIELVDMIGAGCCPDPVGVQAIDRKLWLTLAARNLCIAESLGLDVLTLCNGCYETLKTANFVLKKDQALRSEVNNILSQIDKQLKGNVKVKHLVEVLYHDIGLEKIRQSIRRPLNGLKVAVHYGCHLVRPSDVIDFDDPERPTVLDELVNVTGAISVPYLKKMLCCGSGLRMARSSSALEITKMKLVNVQRAGADCMTVVCPFCMMQYDVSQPLIKQSSGEKFNIPILYYPELLYLALGKDSEELGLKFHRINVEPVLAKIDYPRSHGKWG